MAKLGEKPDRSLKNLSDVDDVAFCTIPQRRRHTLVGVRTINMFIKPNAKSLGDPVIYSVLTSGTGCIATFVLIKISEKFERLGTSEYSH